MQKALLIPTWLAAISHGCAQKIAPARLQAKKQPWQAALVIIAALVVGIYVYSLFLPSNHSNPANYEFIVDGVSDTQMLRPSAEPGGPQLIGLPPLEGQQSYWFICELTLQDDSTWLRRREGPTSFVKSDFLRRPPGLETAKLLDCNTMM